jgi:exosome complex RNA-binding protein Rrp4
MAEQQGASVERTAPQPGRHAWALEKHGHLLAEALRKDNSTDARAVEKLPESQIPAHIVSLILEKADPTKNKGMTAWLVGQYAQGKLRLEDLGTANETLTMFRRYAQRLEKSERDLGKYQSLASVWNAVIGFAKAEEQQISGKAQKALERDKAYAESRILRQDPDGYTVAVPLTEFAAKWWGRGTRWCTSAEKDNQFWQYNKIAPLFIFVIPELKEKGKFQLWATEGDVPFIDAADVQFMDAADQSPPEDLVAKYWPRFEPIISFAWRYNGLALTCVPEVFRTEEMCQIAVAQNGKALQYVPEHLRTDEFCRFAVAQSGWALNHVPEVLRTDGMCRIAVTQDGYVLCHVPKDLRTDEMCRIAVAQTGHALTYVPEKLRTDEICRIAVTKTGGALQYAPEDLRTEEICKIAVSQNGWALRDVPWDLRTVEMCKIAVAQNGQALYHVPKELRTVEMCKIAVAQNGQALEDMPEDLRTEQLCRIAVAKDGWALAWVPEDLRTEELCRIAVEQDGQALLWVPGPLRDRISALIPPPVPSWDISLLDELVNLLDATSSPVPLGLRHA